MNSAFNNGSSSMRQLTQLLSDTNNKYLQDLIMDIYSLAKQTAKETVKEEIKNFKEQINLEVLMNGQHINSKIITDEVINAIISEIF